MTKLKFILLVCVFSLITGAAYAHPPSDIQISFDPKTKMLSAVVIHNTSNPASHYIKKVDLGLNGKEVKELDFSKQENNLSQSFIYSLDNVKSKDVISVEGYCSISGKLKKELTVNL